MTADVTSSETDSETDSSPATRGRGLSAIDLALVAAFAALISVCAYLGSIPVGGAGVPITLQTFAVMLAGCVLGPVRGGASVLLYLGLGAIGLPVFAGHSGGVGVFTSISAGYLISFPIAAVLAGFLVKYVAGAARTRALAVFACSIAGSILVIHPMGIAGMMIHQDLDFATALKWDTPFWVGDLLKTTLVAIIAAEVHRAFPSLLARD